MTTTNPNLPMEYWQNLIISAADVEFIQNYLFEKEQPLSSDDLTKVLITERIRLEGEKKTKEQDTSSTPYLPSRSYNIGQNVSFPALNYAIGEVVSVRDGKNPAESEFKVMVVNFSDGSRKQFACEFSGHELDRSANAENLDDQQQQIQQKYGRSIQKKISHALSNEDSGLIQIAYRWFPEALLVSINQGELNLAEAILEMNAPKPMTTKELLAQIQTRESENQDLLEFSMNYALQEDGRFDEVGPRGLILWCLLRFEPEAVLTPPDVLVYNPIEHDRTVLNEQEMQFEANMADELSELDRVEDLATELSITLNFPHWRVGTLPISPLACDFFPTSYEAPRILFTMFDMQTGEEINAWVVRDHGYVFGLREMFEKNKLIPGSIITFYKDLETERIKVDFRTRKANKEWIRTVLAGSDGGLVFALLKQEISTEYNERLAMVIPDVTAVDAAIKQSHRSHRKLVNIVKNIFVELAKLNPQGHVHIEELYSAVNILLRIPPAPLLSILNSSEVFTHIGDLHYRLKESDQEGN